ncbi:transcriptional regulator [Brevibacillus formosus]|uniref:transcriptional regulator n=1 Tax=Brevibacillus formosus TaxID=54913 RepID=UPI0018CF82F5|nr:transcriptional regulator [Brevibacillus formosus]MBG9944677.1 RinA family phage transcriptional regulator [Brevibacillus formosus]
MSALTKIRKGTFQHIESELFAYHETRKEIVRLKNEILYGKPHFENIGGGRSNLPGDPTARTATLLTTHRELESLERIATSIESVYEALPEDKKRMIQLKYWSKPQTRTWDGIAVEMSTHRATLIRWRNEIVRTIALKMGWR